jgi:pilus assembly protein CpaE
MPQDVTLRIGVVSADAKFRATVAEVLNLYPDLATVVSDTPTAAASLNAGTIDKLQTENAEVILIDLDGDPAASMRMLRLVGDAAPNRTIIATGPALTPDLLIEGMRAGIAEYLPSPVDSHDLADALRRAGRRLGRGYAQGAIGRLLTFVGAKGGTGVTTGAVNAALSLHKQGQRTLLLDLNLEGGNLALAMGLRPRYSVADLLENFHRVDESLLSSLVATHGSGVEVLAAPMLPESMPAVAGDQARAVLRLLRRHYDLVVADLGRPYSEFGRAALEASDTTFLMVVPDVLAIHGARRLLPLIRKGTESRSGRIEVVLNRSAPDDEVQRHDVEEALDIRHVHVLRRDDAVMLSAVNVGQPVCLNGRKTKYAKDMLSLCAALDASVGMNGKEHGVRRLFRGLVPDRTKPEIKS